MEFEKIEIDLLKPAAYNPRKDLKPGDKEYKKIKRSIEEFGYVEPIIVNSDNTIIGGHQRVKVLKDLGYNEIDVIKIDIDKTKEKALNVALNKITGEWDQDKLQDILADLKLEEFDLNITGFDIDELDEILGIEKEIIEDNYTGAVPEEPKSQYGEIYELGNHRIMCGDSTKEEDVEKLLDGKEANLIFTDPPYGVDYESQKLGKIQNDTLEHQALYEFHRDAFEIAANNATDNSAFYCWHEDRNRNIIQQALEEAGLEYKQNLIWNKGMNLSGADYQKAHENCLYFQKQNQKAKWFGGRDKKTILGLRRRELQNIKKSDLIRMITNMQEEQTVWDYDRDSVTEYLHPTQKPVILSAKTIMNSSEDEDIVLDMFAGSGSTLIACEQTNRKCYAMELDAKYIDVIIDRWEKFTGNKVTKISNG